MNIEHYKKQAKHLLKDWKGGNTPGAARRLSAYIDVDTGYPCVEITLQKCQHVVAREAGYEGWKGLLDACKTGKEVETR